MVEELARVGGKGFDIAALAFGIEGVEGQTRLARPRRPRQNDEAVARDADMDASVEPDEVTFRDMDAAEVMGARSMDDDFVVLGSPAKPRDGVQQAGRRAHGRSELWA